MIHRDAAIETARGLTVFIMPSIHTVVMYSQPQVHHSWLGYILQFFAEGTGATLFMFLMGFFIGLGRPKTPKQIVQRSLYLFTAGYLLNLFRAVIPLQLGWFPPEFIGIYHHYQGVYPALELLLTGDIFQLAGLAYAIVSFVSQARKPVILVIILYIGIACISPFVWNIRSLYLWADHLLALGCAGDSRAFFPLFPWLCYPLAGWLAAHLSKTIKTALYYKKAGLYAGITLLAGVVIYHFSPASWDPDFYRSSPGRTIIQTGFIMLWICFIRLLIIWLPKTLLFNLLGFCSRHIMMIYSLQWIIICWGIGMVGYQHLGLNTSLMAIGMVTTVTLGLTYILKHVNKKA